MAEEQPKPTTIKLMMLGNSGVGKSSIMNRFTDNTFIEGMMSTAGVDFKSKTVKIDGKNIKLALWDTAGQERFSTVTNAYYRGATGILLVYDCTDEQSFKDIEVWMNNIKQHASENVEKILIANKTDMFHVRKISPERGADLALEHNMPFAEVSAKASVGVNDAFDMLVRNIIRNRGDLLEQAAQAGTAPIKVTSKAKFPIGPNPCACN